MGNVVSCFFRLVQQLIYLCIRYRYRFNIKYTYYNHAAARQVFTKEEDLAMIEFVFLNFKRDNPNRSSFWELFIAEAVSIIYKLQVYPRFIL